MNTATVHVIGHIWQPGIGLYAAAQSMRAEELDRVAYPTYVDREAVVDWAYTAFGDFQEITDVSLTFHRARSTPDLDWQKEDSELIYNDCMFPQDDDS